jgi:hypothetical protein
MQRRQPGRPVAALVVSGVLVLAGMWFALGDPAGEVAPLGWTFVVVGVVGLVVNLVLLDRLR